MCLGAIALCASCNTVKDPADSDAVNIQFSVIEPNEVKVVSRGFNPDPPATWLGPKKEGYECSDPGDFVRTLNSPVLNQSEGKSPHVSQKPGQVSVIVSASSPSGIEDIDVDLLVSGNGSNNGAVTETGPNTSFTVIPSSDQALWRLTSAKTPFADRKKTKLLTFSYVPGIAKKGSEGAFITVTARGFFGPPNDRKSVEASRVVVQEAVCIPCIPANGCIMP
jgi:hypothetical protein